MKKLIPFVAFLLFGYTAISQVGIGNTDPKASLDISATNIATPANTDGLLIPRIDEFPSTTPTADQDGMMVFITGNGAPAKGFYYWNNAGTSWDAFAGSSDADWYEEGTTTAPTSNSADIFTDGNVGIGTNTVTFPLQVATTSSLRTASLLNSSTDVSATGLNNTIIESSAATSGSTNGIVNSIGRSNQSSISGVSNSFQNSSVTSGFAYLFGYQNSFGNSTSNITYSLINRFQGTTNTAYGVKNLIGGTLTDFYGVDNTNLPGAGPSGDFYGLYNFLTEGGAGEHYGVYTYLSHNGAGDKYGEFINIPNSAGGVHYGLYADVQKANSYAAYIIGRTSLGNGASNRYLMPAADGTNGQVMTTDGSGNVSFQDVSGGDADWFGEGTTTAPNAISDDIFTQGNVAIGKNTADYPLDIELTGSAANPILTKMVDNSTGTGDHTGLQQTMGGAHNQTVKGIETFITNTGNGLHTAFTASVQNGGGNQIGMRNTVSGLFGNNTLYSGGILSDGSTTTNTQTGLDITIAQATSQITYGIFSSLNAAGSGSSGIKYGFYNLIDGGLGTHYGVYNDVRGLSNNTKYGTYNLFGIGTTDTGGVLYGTYNAFGNSITSTTDKYGTYTSIPSGLGGTHYGTYSDVRNTSGFAAYFIGRTSLGNTAANRYLMPAADGTNGQVMTTDGAGNVTFQTLAGDTDWTTVGADIERQSGDVYIGNVNTTDNDLYVSDRIIDWDNSSYYLNPDDISVMDEIQFDNGSAADPSIRFSDTDTGFFSPSVGRISFTGNGTERFRIQSDGEIQYRTTTATNYDFTALGVSGNDGISIGSSTATIPIISGFIANDVRDDILRLDIQSGNSNFNHSAVYATNNIGGTTARLTYNNGTPTGRYAVYADGGTGYAGYSLGDVAIGTLSTDTYTMPASRGSNGQTMQTDGAGNVSWVNPATSEWTDGGTFLYPSDGTSEDVVIGQNSSGTGRVTIDAGNKAASVKTNKSGSFSSLHFGIDNYISNTGGGGTVGVNNLIEGTGGSNLRFGTRTIINGSSSPTAVSHYGSYNEINTTGTGFRYGTYNAVSASAGGTHYGTYNEVAPASGWAGYFLGKSYISNKLGVGTGAENPDGFLEVRADNSGTEPNLSLVDIGSSGARINLSNTATTNGNVWTFFGDTDNTTASSRLNIFHPGGGNIIQMFGDGRVGINRAPTTNSFEVNGTASKSAAGDWLANSDRRLKKNIQTINTKSALERITNLRGVMYEWDDDQTGNDRPEGIQYGFIAQELMEVFPEHVSKDGQGFYQTAYGTYDALYVQAFKEQQKQIETLQNENKKLKQQLSKFETLEARLSALENDKKTSVPEIVLAEK